MWSHGPLSFAHRAIQKYRYIDRFDKKTLVVGIEIILVLECQEEKYNHYSIRKI